MLAQQRSFDRNSIHRVKFNSSLHIVFYVNINQHYSSFSPTNIPWIKIFCVLFRLFVLALDSSNSVFAGIGRFWRKGSSNNVDAFEILRRILYGLMKVLRFIQDRLEVYSLVKGLILLTRSLSGFSYLNKTDSQSHQRNGSCFNSYYFRKLNSY